MSARAYYTIIQNTDRDSLSYAMKQILLLRYCKMGQKLKVWIE